MEGQAEDRGVRPGEDVGLSVPIPGGVGSAGRVSPRTAVWPVWQGRAVSGLMNLGVALSSPHREGCELLAGPVESGRYGEEPAWLLCVRILTRLCSVVSHAQLLVAVLALATLVWRCWGSCRSAADPGPVCP